MSATSLILDISTPLDRENVTNRKEGGEVQTHLQTVAGKEGGGGSKKEKVQQENSSKSVININLLGSGLEFSQDQETGLTIIKMYDRETGKLVRQLPPKETLAFLRRLA